MFYSFYKTPTNVIKSWYPCSLPWHFFFLLFPLSTHPMQPPGSLSAFPALRSHLGPSHRPLSRFLGRDENTLSERGSSASRSSVSGWGYPFVWCVFVPVRSGMRAAGTAHPTAARGWRTGSGTCQKRCSARRWKGSAPAAHRSRNASWGWATLLGKSRKIPFKWQE